MSADRYPEIFRRILLGATTALLTARLLAPGEDPGMLQITSGPTNLLLPLFWLLAAVGLAIWRVWSRGGDWRGGVVEAALLVAAGLAFVSAEWAGYKHPARIIAWDWLILFFVVCLVRQLAVSPGDQQAMFAVFLAGTAALAAQAVYQAAYLRVAASATFVQPGPFAALMALFLPGMAAAHYVCHLRRADRRLTSMTAIFALLGVIALVFALISAFKATNAPLLDVWQATWKMILDRPTFGFGAGNFSRAFPRFQSPGGGDVTDPRNFVLEIAATCGVVALLAFLTALGVFFFRATRWVFGPTPAADESTPDDRTRWEFYIGGMCGLVLGFMIRESTGDRTPNAILVEGFVACGRCLVWLTAFVLFERIAWPGRVRVAALALGVLAALLVLLTNPGIGLPSVTVPLWAAVALALNGLPQPDYARVNRLAVTRILPVAVMAAVALLYFFDIFNPVTSCSARLQTAARDSQLYLREALKKDPSVLHTNLAAFLRDSPLGQAAQDDPDDSRVKASLAQWTTDLWAAYPEPDLITKTVMYAWSAEKMDPQNLDGYAAEYQLRMYRGGRLHLESSSPALALGLGYRAFLMEARAPLPEPNGLSDLRKAKENYGGKPTESEREQLERLPEIQYLKAAEVLERFILNNAPNDARWRFWLAEALLKAREDDWCREQAAAALRLDAAASRPPLTDEQRRKLNVWKDLPPPGG